MSCKILVVDQGYDGNENFFTAKSYGTRFLSCPTGRSLGPVDGDGSQPFDLTEFDSDDEGSITRCPLGQAAESFRRDIRGGYGFTATFVCAACRSCKDKEQSPVKIGKRSASLKFTKKAMISEKKDKADSDGASRKRSGIESRFSFMKRMYGLGRLTVRGLKQMTAHVLRIVTIENLRRGWRLERKRNKANRVKTQLPAVCIPSGLMLDPS
ncbi:MAG: transposase [Deltaproteobacteria bacterium]|jgi:hypothetical protein|nr:transposase [Deltaproteobacteria bacterium]